MNCWSLKRCFNKIWPFFTQVFPLMKSRQLDSRRRLCMLWKQAQYVCLWTVKTVKLNVFVIIVFMLIRTYMLLNFLTKSEFEEYIHSYFYTKTFRLMSVILQKKTQYGAFWWSHVRFNVIMKLYYASHVRTWKKDVVTKCHCNRNPWLVPYLIWTCIYLSQT